MKLTPRIVAYLAHEEGLVQEAYKDSEGVWTWALGVTNASGHEVHPRYLDKVQDLARCLEVSVWLMRERYLPVVERAFVGIELSEAQIAAALGFHWNTGAIASTSWVRMVKAGDRAGARRFLTTHYVNNGTLLGRREREAALFFDGEWPDSMACPVFPVRKPSYAPNFGKAQAIDLLPVLEGMGL